MADGTYQPKVYRAQGGDRQVVASGGEIDIESGGALKFAGEAITATAAELNAAADVSGRLVTLTGDTAITAALHAGRTCLLGEVGGDAALAATLPAATGTGDRYRFVVSVLNTSGYTIKVADATDTFNGLFILLDNDANAVTGYAAIGGDDTLTLDGTTKGGQVGDWFEVEDIALNTWAVRGSGIVPAGSNVADPFTAAV
ncbi:MAG: hypothetical protein A3E01_09865 [Gammaproteobacteria bacterium RIFCSPHIGHO2_12_FULL_63_22]|nr:MAG: hypothetical protein A3E01_09865 [Gammaproteobacteria bacterium RIFCSPHIGHO2_12_FULL_63_22]